MAGLSDLALRELTSDSREAKPGVAFAAFPGEARDGRDFIPDAIGRGTPAVLWQSDGYTWRPDWRVPNAGVPQLKSAIGPIASHVYGRPSHQLRMVGVTGTNGKTSCSNWVAQAFNQLGRRAAVIGTLGNGMIGHMQAATHTTPDAIRLQRLLAEFLAQGAECVAMEASSHGLQQERVNGTAFDVALFTNLSRDHLDYHGDMVAYGAAKARLFAMPGLKHAVVNIDDEYGALLADSLAAMPLRLTTYGIGRGSLQAEHVQLSAEGIRAEIRYGAERRILATPVLGNFNVSNLLGVIGVLIASDVPFGDAVNAAARLRPVAGRLQQLGGGTQPTIAIDYAHTPDALEKALATLRPVVAQGGRLVCVFGCGGDRDRGKRPLMGAIATRLADLTIVTSDNPRGETPSDIIADIVGGIEGGNFEVSEEREQAIRYAIGLAGAGDVVLIAGKGHEDYQEIHGVRQPFSDLDVAARVLAEAGG
jgi:UDP-N-acetylmuramyl-tripeptide synthetase